MVGAARTIWQTTLDEMPFRIDIKNRSRDTTKHFRAMRAWDAARSIRSATTDLAAADAVRPLLQIQSGFAIHGPEGESAPLRRETPPELTRPFL